MASPRLTSQPPRATSQTPRTASQTPRTASQTPQTASVPSAQYPPVATQPRRPPLERLLDHNLQSVSSFISSCSGSAGERRNVGSAGRIPTGTGVEEMPAVVLFPTNKPSSRADAVILDRWVTSSLSKFADTCPGKNMVGEEDISHAVESLVPLLSLGLHEVVRQVQHHCMERGLVLEKIWRTYVELFERALSDSRAALRRQRERTGRVESELARTRGELRELQEKHPEQIDKLSKTLAGKFAQRTSELEEQLNQLRAENMALQKSLKEQSTSVNSWFPLFQNYKEAPLRKELANAGASMPSAATPEAGIASDFKRIISTMPTDRRRRVGFFVSSLLGLRSGQLQPVQDSVEGLTEKRDHNKRKIEQLQQHLRALQSGEAEKERRPNSLGKRRSMSKDSSKFNTTAV